MPKKNPKYTKLNTKSTKLNTKSKTAKTATSGGNNLRKNLLNSNSNNYKIFSSK